jgi:hypothetical protein
MIDKDCVYLRADTKLVCQDYAVVGTNEVGSFGIVADGCSSAKNSDIGARVLTHHATSLLPLLGRENALLRSSMGTVTSLGLGVECLHATLLTVEEKGSSLVATMYGDGYIVVGYQNKSFRVFEVSYGLNMPEYLVYQIHEEWQQSFQQKKENVKVVRELMISPKGKVTEKSLSCSLASVEQVCVSKHSVRLLGIASDGLGSYVYQDSSEHVPVEKIIPILFGFKNTLGSFVTRRTVGALRTENELQLVKSTDDVALAVLAPRQKGS